MKYAVSLYVVVSIVWIVLTDFYVELLSIPPHMKPYVQTFKGALFVILSAVFMYIALKKTSPVKANERKRERIVNAHSCDA